MSGYASAYVHGPLSPQALGDSNTQQGCAQYGSNSTPLPPNGISAWDNGGLDRALDIKILKKVVIAYKIKFFSGNWSGWYVKGVNDTYPALTINLTTGIDVDARLAWIYFFDHEHQYIACNI
jgi:hypothetical protein